MRCVYLDQLHLGPQAEPELRVFQSFVDRGAVVAPASSVHFFETAIAEESIRRFVRASLLRVSAGLVIANEAFVMRVEAEAYRQGRDMTWIRDLIVSLSPWDMLPPSPDGLAVVDPSLLSLTLRDFFEVMEPLTDSLTNHRNVNAILKEGAEAANRRAAEAFDWDSVLTALDAGDLRCLDTDTLLRTFRTIASRRALQSEIHRARPVQGLEANDLTDLAFLSVALPYLDAVCVDRRMHARIEAARASASCEWARSFRRLEDLNTWLENDA